MSEYPQRPVQGDMPQPLGRRRRTRRSSSGIQRLGRRFRRIRRSARRRITLPVILAFLAIIFIVFSVGAAVIITDSVSRLETSWNNVNRVIDVIGSKPGNDLTLTDFNRLNNGMADLSIAIDNLLARIGQLEPLAAAVPEGAEQLTLLRAAGELSKAANQILIGLEPTLNFTVAGDEEEVVAASISSGERIVELLEVGMGSFQRADVLLEEARAQIEGLTLADVSPALLFNVEQLASYYEQVRDINNLLLNSPELLTTALGIGEQRSYIVLSQNSDEIRPSGGYVSTWGWITVRSGRVTDFDYSATTTTSPLPPPADFAQTINPPNWWISYSDAVFTAWDSSWYADFPSTADMARRYYDGGENIHWPVDGVIAIDIIGFEYILEALQAVPMPTYNVVVTPDNFRELVYDVRAYGEPNEHKDFVAEMYAQIFANWQRIDQTQAPALLGALLRALQERHIMIYFTDADLNAAVDLLSWGGNQAPARDHDYLMVVDANQTPNKSNRSINRSLTYDVTINADGSLDSRASVTYEYLDSIASTDPAVDEEFHGRLDYFNLMQVFLPLGAQFDSMSNMQDIVREEQRENHTLLVTNVTIEYDSIERYQFAYRVPPIIQPVGQYQRYRLLLQKQPGIISQMTNVQLALPPGARLVRSEPAPTNVYDLDEQRLDYRINLTTDQWIEVVYQD